MPRFHKTAHNSCGMCCTKINNLSVTLGGQNILENINLHIHCGELTAVIGPNGAGKSTLLKAILGVIPHGGSILFTDVNNNQTTRPRIGYVPQHLELDRNAPISVMDLFSVSSSKFPAWFGTRKSEHSRALKLLSDVNAEHLIDRSVGALSGGELQRVLLALALQNQPDILLLDEPVSGVDANGMELFYKAIDAIRSSYDLTIILISHDFSMVSKFADRLVLLNRRVLSAGSAGEVLSSPQFKAQFSQGGGADAGNI